MHADRRSARNGSAALIQPFAGVRPPPGRAQDVIAPLYDVLDVHEARRRSAGKPHSFLHVSKAEIDLPDATNPYSDEVYAMARASFDAMRAKGVLRQDDRACYYVYRLDAGGERQTGLVAAISIDAYTGERIRKHEHTQPARESDRARQIERLNAHTGPVLLTYRQRRAIDALVAKIAEGPADTEVVSDDGVRHALWVVRDDGLIERLTECFDDVERLYIADGHHRTAAAARVAHKRRGETSSHGSNGHDRFLAILVPDSEVRIVDYNRAVTDLNGLTVGAFLDLTREAFDVTAERGPVRPARAGEFGMYVGGAWYRMAARDAGTANASTPQLDVNVLHEALLAPILGVGDPRIDSRVAFIGGGRGLSELERRVDAGEMAVAFALHPTSLSDMMSIADAGGVMPPKSTCFEPKVVDGLVTYLLE